MSKRRHIDDDHGNEAEIPSNPPEPLQEDCTTVNSLPLDSLERREHMVGIMTDDNMFRQDIEHGLAPTALVREVLRNFADGPPTRRAKRCQTTFGGDKSGPYLHEFIKR